MANRGAAVARVGTGDKPSSIRPPAPPVKRPSGLDDDERKLWRKWAPLAMAKRTLTAQTLPGFLLLLGFELERRDMKATIARDGWVSGKTTTRKDGTVIEQTFPHALLLSYGRIQKLVEVNLARYGLAAFGKSEPDLPKTARANAWAEIAR